ncbi:YveK family protein [Geomicrobium sp. JSM 1781026]|uniref:YveK family protein n=1 Tax=Geomicrobium sp. JSM 1781026 TaxID=3344580 RepID=UPI0035BF34A2
MEETISLQEIFATIKKRLLMIFLITFVAVGLSGVVSYFVLTPEYEASTQLLVNQETDSQTPVNVNDLRTNVELINTYSVIMTSPAILDLVINELGLQQSVSDLQDKITVSSEGDSQVVSVSVQHESPASAITIANTVANTFEAEIPSIMNIDNVSILSVAGPEQVQSPVSPQPLLNMAIAFVVGMMAAIGLAFLLEYLDNTIKNQSDIEDQLGLPLLGVIPVFNEDDERVDAETATRKERTRRVEEKIT